MTEPKIIRIEVTKEDGTKLLAEGDVADAIWKWYGAGETMNLIHGAEFKGKGFDVLAAAPTAGKGDA